MEKSKFNLLLKETFEEVNQLVGNKLKYLDSGNSLVDFTLNICAYYSSFIIFTIIKNIDNKSRQKNLDTIINTLNKQIREMVNSGFNQFKDSNNVN